MNLNGQTIGIQGLVTMRSSCSNDFQKYSQPSQAKIDQGRKEQDDVADEVDARLRARRPVGVEGVGADVASCAQRLGRARA